MFAHCDKSIICQSSVRLLKSVWIAYWNELFERAIKFCTVPVFCTFGLRVLLTNISGEPDGF